PAVTVWLTMGHPVDLRNWGRLLRSIASLLLQLLILAVLMLAWADPWSIQEPAKRLTIVVDLSATMQTLEQGGQSRLDMAVARAKGLIDEAADDVEVSVIGAAHQTRMLTPAPVTVTEAGTLLDQLRAL